MFVMKMRKTLKLIVVFGWIQQFCVVRVNVNANMLLCVRACARFFLSLFLCFLFLLVVDVGFFLHGFINAINVNRIYNRIECVPFIVAVLNKKYKDRIKMT